jgi:SulP family sulfate permease
MLNSLFPWWRDHRTEHWGADALAGLVVSLILVPQSLAYALLAGVTPQMGLMAAIAGQLGYALLGRSPALSVGPVAIASAMTMDALSPLALPGSAQWYGMAGLLAVLSGLMLLLMGLLRLGFIAHLLSHSVIGGFISGAAVLIVLGQFKYWLNVPISGDTAYSLLQSLWNHGPSLQLAPLLLGLGCLLALIAARYLSSALPQNGVYRLSKTFPLLLLCVVTVFVHQTELSSVIPTLQSTLAWGGSTGLPHVAAIDTPTFFRLLQSAALIALIGFIESYSMAKAIGQIHSKPVDANAELRGLGAANLAAGLSGGFAVTGGLSRSVVNLEAGARSPMAGVFASLVMLLVWLGPSSLLSSLPLAALAAMIMAAVGPLISLHAFLQVWRYDRADGLGWLLTFIGVLLGGVEVGVMLGVTVALATVVMRQGRPHIAEIGCVPGTEHFRNVLYHQVQTLSNALFVRIDANLFFGNWDWIQENLQRKIQSRQTAMKHLVLSLSSVNDIDHSAYLGLREWARELHQQDVQLHLAEIKNPLLHKLRQHEANPDLPLSWAQEHLSTYQAFQGFSGRENAD